jgi:chromosome segregation ATPase
MNMLLNQRAKAREQENELMRVIKNEIQELKNKIDEETQINELNIMKKVKVLEEEEIRKMLFLSEELRKDIEYYVDRTQFEEEEIDRIGNEKVILQQDLIDSAQLNEDLEKNLKINKQELLKLQKENHNLQIKLAKLRKNGEPLEKQINNLKVLIPSIQDKNSILLEELQKVSK